MDDCPRGVSWGTLVDYWGADLAADDENALEEHVFACDTCTRRLGALCGLGDAVRNWTRIGRLKGGASQTVLEKLAGRLSVRHYRVAPDSPDRYGAGPQDDLVVLRLCADLKDLDRVDLEVRRSHTDTVERFKDLPIVRGRAVLYTDQAERLRKLPRHVATMRLKAVENGVERVLASYSLEFVPQA